MLTLSELERTILMGMNVFFKLCLYQKNYSLADLAEILQDNLIRFLPGVSPTRWIDLMQSYTAVELIWPILSAAHRL